VKGRRRGREKNGGRLQINPLICTPGEPIPALYVGKKRNLRRSPPVADQGGKKKRGGKNLLISRLSFTMLVVGKEKTRGLRGARRRRRGKTFTPFPPSMSAKAETYYAE